jgi:monothiol glutaredoxin
MKECGQPFAYINVIEDPEVFQNLPRYQNWPTFPQIYLSGELIGGHDILMEMHEKGELKPALEAATTAGPVTPPAEKDT